MSSVRGPGVDAVSSSCATPPSMTVARTTNPASFRVTTPPGPLRALRLAEM